MGSDVTVDGSMPPTPDQYPGYAVGPGGSPYTGPGSSTSTEHTEPGDSAPTDTIAPTDPQKAKAELEAIAAHDRPAVDMLADSWVSQLSAKKPGLVADGITYDNPAILQNYLDLRAQYTDVLLLRSGDFTSFKYSDFWVTIRNQSYSDGPAANSWCDDESIAWDDCYAKLLSHSAKYEGATLLRSK